MLERAEEDKRFAPHTAHVWVQIPVTAFQGALKGLASVFGADFTIQTRAYLPANMLERAEENERFAPHTAHVWVQIPVTAFQRDHKVVSLWLTPLLCERIVFQKYRKHRKEKFAVSGTKKLHRTTRRMILAVKKNEWGEPPLVCSPHSASPNPPFVALFERLGISPSADGDQRTRVGSVPPFEKGGRKLFYKLDSAKALEFTFSKAF